jgi:membrane-associated PAP2 superfamily phosphatase
LKLHWQVDVAIAVGAAVVITALFAGGQLDLAFTRPFFSPDTAEHWPLGSELPWRILYQAAPWITASLVVGALVFLGAAALRRDRTLQRRAIFVALAVLLGPGLLVNGVFKDHWNRPRPRDVVELGGVLHYASAPLRGEGGKSFPCGHCSVGFLYALGWWLWRRRRGRAIASLALGLAVGTALGIGRMAAGGHFPSDIVWSAFISFAVAHWLYWYVLRIPEYEAGGAVPRAAARRSVLLRYAPPLLAAAGAAGVLVALFVTAHGALVNETIRLAALPAPPRVFEFSAAAADVDITIVDPPAASVQVHGETHGFGFPGSRLTVVHDYVSSPEPTLRYRMEQRGRFTDLDCRLAFELPATDLRTIVIRIGRGNVSIRDRTRARVIANRTVHVEARSDAGSIRISD